MSPSELQELVLLADKAARRGGAILQDWRQRFSVREKGRFDLVTEADLASQEAVRSFLQQHCPEFGFLGEESANKIDPNSAQPTWIVDPLDGTTNYVHDNPIYCVSIGLAKAGVPIVGVIYDPSRDEAFQAAQGLGARLNGHELRTTQIAKLEEALLSTGFPPDLRGQELALENWRRFSLRTQSLRRTGSTALNLAYVACGRHDGFWTHQAFAWDACAGVIIIREAGGTVTKPNGSPYDLAVPHLLASNGPLHPAMLEVLSTGEPGA